MTSMVLTLDGEIDLQRVSDSKVQLWTGEKGREGGGCCLIQDSMDGGTFGGWRSGCLWK